MKKHHLKPFNDEILLSFKQELNPYFESQIPINSTRHLASIACQANIRLGVDYLNFHQLHDLAEVCLNKFITSDLLKSKNHVDAFDTLIKLENVLPNKHERNQHLLNFQQFSTPLPLCYLMCLASNIDRNDIVFEPSAGTGTLAGLCRLFNPIQIHVNELCSYRNKLLNHLNFDSLHKEDANYLCHLDTFIDLKATKILMNPPFAKSAKRKSSHKAPAEAAKHISASLNLLPDNGRLISVVGQGMGLDSHQHKKWWNNIQSQYNLKANLLLTGGHFKTRGTGFNIRVIIIDKTAPLGTPVTGLYETYEAVLNEILNSSITS